MPDHDESLNFGHRLDSVEEAVNDDAKSIEELKKEISELKKALVNAVILERTLYAYMGVDKMSGEAEKLRTDIRNHLNGLHTLLGISGP